MGLFDSISGVLQQYSGSHTQTRPEDVQNHFDQVSSAVPRESLAAGLSDAFRSNQTPPFGQLVSQLFGQANPQQRSGIISALLSAAGPTVLSSLFSKGGGFGSLVSAYQGGGVTPQHVQQVTPETVEQLASHVEQHNPSVVDHMGGFFSQHPALLKSLGAGSLGTILSKVAQKAA